MPVPGYGSQPGSRGGSRSNSRMGSRQTSYADPKSEASGMGKKNAKIISKRLEKLREEQEAV